MLGFLARECFFKVETWRFEGSSVMKRHRLFDGLIGFNFWHYALPILGLVPTRSITSWIMEMQLFFLRDMGLERGTDFKVRCGPSNDTVSLTNLKIRLKKMWHKALPTLGHCKMGSQTLYFSWASRILYRSLEREKLTWTFVFSFFVTNR